MTPQSSSSLY